MANLINTMSDFLSSYFNADDKFYIITLHRPSGILHQQKLHTLESFKKMEKYYFALNKKGMIDIYYSLASYSAKNNFITRKKEYVSQIKTFFLDFDEDGRRHVNLAYSTLGIPTFEIQTSQDKFQLLYCFKESLNNNNSIKDFEDISKEIIHDLHADKQTFDATRVARLPLSINNKQELKFKTKIQYNEVYYDFKDFKHYKPCETINKVKKSITKTRTLKREKTLPLTQLNTDFNPNNKYYKKYVQFVQKNNEDYSSADFSFVLYLRFQEKLENDIITKHLFECRENLIEKHGHEIERYIHRLLHNTKQY